MISLKEKNNRLRRNRIIKYSVMIALMVSFSLWILNSLRDNLVFFFSPTEITQGKASGKKHFRLGGMVQEGSFRKLEKLGDYEFIVTDFQNSVPVFYSGTLPDIFREKQGVVAEGSLLDNGTFNATTVLTKHDEKYMPPEIAKTLNNK